MGMPDRTPVEALQDAMPRFIAARRHIMTTMQAWRAWWGPIRENVLATYQEMDEENRTVIDVLENLWRMGPGEAEKL
jgi:hypothetical protein